MKIEKIIYENREELFDAANKCDERLESKAAGSMRTALEETPYYITICAHNHPCLFAAF